MTIKRLNYKIPTGALKEVILSIKPKTHNLLFVFVLDKIKQNEILVSQGLKKMTKLKRKFEFNNLKEARMVLFILKQRFHILTGQHLQITDKTDLE